MCVCRPDLPLAIYITRPAPDTFIKQKWPALHLPPNYSRMTNRKVTALDAADSHLAENRAWKGTVPMRFCCWRPLHQTRSVWPSRNCTKDNARDRRPPRCVKNDLSHSTTTPITSHQSKSWAIVITVSLWEISHPWVLMKENWGSPRPAQMNRRVSRVFTYKAVKQQGPARHHP